jgi:hypothetical protein
MYQNEILNFMADHWWSAWWLFGWTMLCIAYRGGAKDIIIRTEKEQKK